MEHLEDQYPVQHPEHQVDQVEHQVDQEDQDQMEIKLVEQEIHLQ